MNPIAAIRTAFTIAGWVAAAVFAVQIYGVLWIKGYRVELRDAQTALAAQKLAHTITLQSLDAVTMSLEVQTKLVREWGRIAGERRKAARMALDAAVSRATRAEGYAVRIDMERARRPSGGPVCPTSEAVMAARDEL